MIVYLARDIPQFVMYCVNGKLRSSLFIESTDSMIRFHHMTMSILIYIVSQWLLLLFCCTPTIIPLHDYACSNAYLPSFWCTSTSLLIHAYHLSAARQLAFQCTSISLSMNVHDPNRTYYKLVLQDPVAIMKGKRVNYYGEFTCVRCIVQLY